MKICGIISEYNIFHNGHRYHIEKTRQNGATHVVAVMSGNFVQRGEAAIMEKSARAKAALLGGADLVVELPLPYALSSAQGFARGAVSVLDALGCVDMLSFGSECGDVGLIVKAAEANLDDNTVRETKKNLSDGITFAKARELAVQSLYGRNVSDVFTRPNDTLAAEYVTALRLNGSKAAPVAVKRFGAAHDSMSEECGFVSASYLREKLRDKSFDLSPFVPPEVCKTVGAEIEQGRAPVFTETLDIAMLYALRRMDAADLSRLPDISEGLENRIYSAVSESCTVAELMQKIKTKRYTLARIRRILMCALLGVEKDLVFNSIPYIRVLGFNERGREILRTARDTARVPVIMKTSDISALGRDARRLFDAECRATDIYSLAMPKIAPCGLEQTRQVVII